MKRYLKIKQIKSKIGANWKAKRTLEALGLRKIGQVVIKKDTPQIRGMIDKIKYLVEVEEIIEKEGGGS
ncbi:MAG: 50S ribosomal protein L30 [Candidatus Hydrothermales bacterium]